MKKILFIISIFVLSCSKEAIKDELLPYSNKLTYFKDNDSDLCFSYVWVGGSQGGPSMTNVPCENVKKLLVNKPKFIK